MIRARSDRYLSTLYTVAVFYALPVVQFVTAFQMVRTVVHDHNITLTTECLNVLASSIYIIYQQ